MGRESFDSPALRLAGKLRTGLPILQLVKWLNNLPVTIYQLPMFEKGEGTKC